jgi:hypothetical protein
LLAFQFFAALSLFPTNKIRKNKEVGKRLFFSSYFYLCKFKCSTELVHIVSQTQQLGHLLHHNYLQLSGTFFVVVAFVLYYFATSNYISLFFNIPRKISCFSQAFPLWVSHFLGFYLIVYISQLEKYCNCFWVLVLSIS